MANQHSGNYAPPYEGSGTATVLDTAIAQRQERGEQVRSKSCRCDNSWRVDDDPLMEPRCLRCGRVIR